MPRGNKSVLSLIYAGLLIFVGVVILAGGAWLAVLGGALYYVIAGVALIAVGFLLWRGNPWAEHIYALLLLGSLLWAFWESGLNPWALTGRLLAPAILGLGFVIPGVRRTLRRNISWGYEAGGVALLTILVIALSFVLQNPYAILPDTAAGTGILNTADAAPANNDWPNYGRTIGGDRFSPLTQINPDNVSKLQVAWIHRSGDVNEKNLLEPIPIKIGELLYTCTPHFIVIAIDAKSGVERWRADPHVNTDQFLHIACRGISYYARPDATGPCGARIISGRPDGKLWALDALTGQPCQDFGQGGSVSVLENLGPVETGRYMVNAPPAIVRGVAVIGSFVFDSISRQMPSGVIRGYDATTGALRWAWDMGVPDRIGAPLPGEIYTQNTPNAWPPLAGDEELGLVYVPLGNPAMDFFGGGRRPFEEKYGSSLVALDVTNGRPRWSYQTTHHDLWDYDLPAQPALADIPGPDGPTPAIIQATKRGDIFVLDRRDGRPIIPAPEKPVPGGAMEGDWVSKTQPMSDLSLNPPPLKEASMWGLTPIDMLLCRIQFRQSRYDGRFTPPGLRQTIQYPGSLGTMDWGGVSVDGDNKVLVVNTSDFPWTVRHALRNQENPTPDYPQHGLPYVLYDRPFMSVLDIPCMQPPWGHLNAIDLKTGKILWRREVGTARDSGPFGMSVGLPLPLAVPSLGGTIVTRGGLVFMAATLDQYFRAFDLKTGKELWRARLPAGGQATPMTYMVDGKQYVVISAGGHYVTGTKLGDYTIAYALR